MSKAGRRQATRHGYLVIDKPLGWTSHDVVARVRRIVGERRVGHAGTLDPAATGVLPVAVGLATRTIEYLAVADKSYRATIRFGVTTDSADSEGDVIAETDPSHLTLPDIEAALARFRGEISQVPPMHSAIKVDGRRLYELARKGETVEISPRFVTISTLDVVDWAAPDLSIDVTCTKGTYIRSLARDIGEAVGTGAHLAALRRTRTGPFTLDEACSLEQLAARIQSEGWERVALPPDSVLESMERVILSPDQVRDWQHGKVLPLQAPLQNGSLARAYDSQKRWLGIGEVGKPGDTLRPVKVIPVESI